MKFSPREIMSMSVITILKIKFSRLRGNEVPRMKLRLRGNKSNKNEIFLSRNDAYELIKAPRMKFSPEEIMFMR